MGTDTNAQNNAFSTDLWLDTGTWKVCMVYIKDSAYGIHNVQFDGATVGTIDGYAASASSNNYSEITGLSVAVAKVVAVQDLMATKHASSSNYAGDIQSLALIRTSGAASTPAGTDTPGYTWQHFPWMGVKTSATFTKDQHSTALGGGYYTSNGAQNDYFDTDFWSEARTYKYAQVVRKDSNIGIATISIDGSSVGTLDGYNASTLQSQYQEITGIVVATAGVKSIQVKMATKNASSTNYYGYIGSMAWISTGA